MDNADFSDEPIFKAFPEFVTARVKAHTLASWIMWSMLALSTFAVGFNTVCSFLGISTDAD